MSPVGNEILLETGTNELELLEFRVGKNSYGIHVAKVRELLQYQTVQTMPQTHACVEGVICPRNELIPVISLAVYLGHEPSERVDRDIFIIAGFNRMVTAFHVHQVMGIHRISWEAIEKPNDALFGGKEGVITGVAKLEGRLISMLDFEKITADVSPGSTVEASAELIKKPETVDTSHRILVAEDSMVLRRMILEALHKAGYENVIARENGQDAWDYLSQIREEDGAVKTQVSCVITDIEMPKMDGHHLTKRIKESPVLSQIPVIIFSSLISEDMKRKGEEIGADDQLSKPQIHLLVESLRRLIQ